MTRFRFRSSAAILALALLLAPLASAAPLSPAAGSWWSTIAAGFDGLLGLFGLGGADAVTANAEEGPGLEPDGTTVQVTDPNDDPALTDGTETSDGGVLDPDH